MVRLFIWTWAQMRQAQVLNVRQNAIDDQRKSVSTAMFHSELLLRIADGGAWPNVFYNHTDLV